MAWARHEICPVTSAASRTEAAGSHASNDRRHRRDRAEQSFAAQALAVLRELRPILRTGVPHQQAHRLARVAECQDEETGPLILRSGDGKPSVRRRNQTWHSSPLAVAMTTRASTSVRRRSWRTRSGGHSRTEPESHGHRPVLPARVPFYDLFDGSRVSENG